MRELRQIFSLSLAAFSVGCTSTTTVDFQPEQETVTVPQFTLASPVAVGAGARDLLVVDCDRDGHLDVVVANSDAASLSVLVGRGDGSFDEQAAVSAGNSPWTLGSADIDGDNNIDIIVGNYINGASLLLGDGACGFGQPTTILGAAPNGPFSSSALAVAAADMDADGNVDVVAEASGDEGEPPNIAVLWGRGDGSFETPEMLPVDTSIGDILLRDVDADGQRDIVASTSWLNMGSSSFVHVLRGRGNRNFGDPANFAVNTDPENVALGDVDGDGILDLVTPNGASIGDGSVSVLIGDGGGSFSEPFTYPTGGKTAGKNGANALAVGMMNDDEYLDVVVALGNQNRVAILLGAPDGGLSGPQPVTTGDGDIGDDPREPFYVRLADFNEDGALDIAATNFSGSVSVLLSK